MRERMFTAGAGGRDRPPPWLARCRYEAVALQDWPVCLKDAYPGYIGWEEFMANQRRLADNLNRYDETGRVYPQRQRLLQGIVVCGRCGRRMGLRYSGPRGNYPVYQCAAPTSSTVVRVAKRSAPGDRRRGRKPRAGGVGARSARPGRCRLGGVRGRGPFAGAPVVAPARASPLRG